MNQSKKSLLWECGSWPTVEQVDESGSGRIVNLSSLKEHLPLVACLTDMRFITVDPTKNYLVVTLRFNAKDCDNKGLPEVTEVWAPESMVFSLNAALKARAKLPMWVSINTFSNGSKQGFKSILGLEDDECSWFEGDSPYLTEARAHHEDGKWNADIRTLAMRVKEIDEEREMEREEQQPNRKRHAPGRV